jgi:hypothetical protein
VKDMNFIFNKSSSLNSKFNNYNWNKYNIRIIKLYYKIEGSNKRVKVFSSNFVYNNNENVRSFIKINYIL